MDNKLLGLNPMDECVPLAAKLHQEAVYSSTYYRHMRGLTDDEEQQDALIKLTTTPSDCVRWSDLSGASIIDAGATYAAWQRIMQDAREELQSGYRASAVVEKPDSTPMDRARFLVLRESFIQEWQPRGGIEINLIDQLAQAQTEYEYWTKLLIYRTTNEAAEERETLSKDMQRRQKEQKTVWTQGGWIPARVTAAEGISEAKDMVRMWHSNFARVLRQLRDLRRYNTPIFVKNVEQLNAASQQVNIAGDKQV
jgi:hypothetical protein